MRLLVFCLLGPVSGYAVFLGGVFLVTIAQDAGSLAATTGSLARTILHSFSLGFLVIFALCALPAAASAWLAGLAGRLWPRSRTFGVALAVAATALMSVLPAVFGFFILSQPIQTVVVAALSGAVATWLCTRVSRAVCKEAGAPVAQRPVWSAPSPSPRPIRNAEAAFGRRGR